VDYRGAVLRRSRGNFVALFLLAALAIPSEGGAFTGSWRVGKPWPKSSTRPVEALDHPLVED